mmetsp:Transcript_45550/g.142671  ORF Transcript_45550/g.142671 Transcript_45550/m.142671 type:complete len:233 (+) Transcript_45550:249-947(+)
MYRTYAKRRRRQFWGERERMVSFIAVRRAFVVSELVSRKEAKGTSLISPSQHACATHLCSRNPRRHSTRPQRPRSIHFHDTHTARHARTRKIPARYNPFFSALPREVTLTAPSTTRRSTTKTIQPCWLSDKPDTMSVTCAEYPCSRRLLPRKPAKSSGRGAIFGLRQPRSAASACSWAFTFLRRAAMPESSRFAAAASSAPPPASPPPLEPTPSGTGGRCASGASWSSGFTR